MTIPVLYVLSVALFLAIDAVGLTHVIRPLFEAEAGHLLLEDFKLAPAALFYLFYIGGLLYFVSAPALRDSASLGSVFLSGALLGALCYGTFDFTALAVLKDWTWKLALVDVAWGAALTGTVAAGGVAITRLIFT